MYIIDATTKKIQVVLGGAVTTNELPCTAHYATHSATANTPVEFDVSTNGAVAVDLVAAPGAGEQQMVSVMTVYNADTVDADVTILLNNNATLRPLAHAVLATGEMLSYEHGGDWQLRTAAGDVRVVTGAASDATFITQLPHASLTNEQALSALATGLMKVTTATGVVTSIADSAGLLAVIGDATGTGLSVFNDTPTLIAPLLGTPTSGVLTNCTGTAAGLTAGNVSTNANLTGPITSVGNATSIAAQTGTGTTFAMSVSPVFTTGIGAGSATMALLNTTATVINAFGAATPVVVNATGVMIGGTTGPVGKLAVVSTDDNVQLDIVGGGTGGDAVIRLGGKDGAGYIASDVPWGIGVRRASNVFTIAYQAAGAVNLEAGQIVSISVTGHIGMGPAATAPLSVLCIDGGLHVGGMSDAGDNNLLVDGTITSAGGLHTFGANDSAGAGYRLVRVPNI